MKNEQILINYIDQLAAQLATDPEFWFSEDFNQCETNIFQALESIFNTLGRNFEQESEEFVHKATAEERLQYYKKTVQDLGPLPEDPQPEQKSETEIKPVGSEFWKEYSAAAKIRKIFKELDYPDKYVKVKITAIPATIVIILTVYGISFTTVQALNMICNAYGYGMATIEATQNEKLLIVIQTRYARTK